MRLTVSIVTPERPVLETQADSVVVPAFDGELGILSNHAPLLAQLLPGEIRLKTADQTEHFAISGGFVEVRDNKIVVLAETAEAAHEIDLERARQAAERAKSALRDRPADINMAAIESELRRALARLRVAQQLQRRKPRP